MLAIDFRLGNLIKGKEFMPFLKNVWYCVAWAEEFDQKEMFDREILGESVLLFRKEDGTPVAMGNICPHRFAPLSHGRRLGDNVSCPYHGLEFNTDGECVRNPNGDKSIVTDAAVPKACSVPTYPLVERWEAMWIWMGDPAKADPELIPDFSMCVEREGVAVVRGQHTVEGHYELVVDNLMDRTHVQFLHPLLDLGEDMPEGFERVYSMEQIGDVIWDYHCELNSPKLPLLSALWPDAPDVVENYFNVRWEAPGNMLLDAGVVVMDSDRKEGSHSPGANLITPANENQTHYFWNNCRDKNIESEEASQKLKMGIGGTFENEDGRMVGLVSKYMKTNDLLSLNPVLLPSDGAAIRARRVMAQKIAAEQAEA